jgi:hypothetical protein
MAMSPDDLKALVSRKIDVLRFRSIFFWQYCLAITNCKRITPLEEITRKAFAHPRFTGVTMRLYKAPGFRKEEERRIYWGAPVTVTVWLEGVPVLGMAVELRRKRLCIWQLQGARHVEGTPRIPKLPAEIELWHRLFVKACQEFAELQGLREVWVTRAHAQSAYKRPAVGSLQGKAREQAVKNLRGRLRHIYDTTAKKLGFVLGPEWSFWKNPHLK